MKLFLLLLSPLFGSGQMVYTGEVINKESKKKVPFATVGFINANRGINADESGRFSITVNKFSQDTIIISCVGFEILKVPLSNLPVNNQFMLQEKQALLPEIIVTKKHMASITFNHFSSWWCGFNFYTTAGYITQVAQHFHSSTESSLLSAIDICTSGNKSIFRIRLYNMDTTFMQPDKDLTDTTIEVNTDKKHIHLDVGQYKIQVPKDFFVAVEWLKISTNEYSEVYKYKGRKTMTTRYYPLVSCKNLESTRVNLNNTPTDWMLNYQKKWQPQQNYMLLISATIKN